MLKVIFFAVLLLALATQQAGLRALERDLKELRAMVEELREAREAVEDDGR